MAHAVEQRSVAHRLFDDTRQSVRRTDFLLLEPRQDERAAHTGLHGVEVPQLPAPDFVHPDPLPRRAEVDDLLCHVPQAAQLFASRLESLGGTWGKVARRLIGLGPLPWAQIEVARPIVSVWLVHGAPKVQAVVKSRNRAGSRSLPHDCCGTAIRPSFPMLNLMTSPLRPNQRLDGSRSEG